MQCPRPTRDRGLQYKRHHPKQGGNVAKTQGVIGSERECKNWNPILKKQTRNKSLLRPRRSVNLTIGMMLTKWHSINSYTCKMCQFTKYKYRRTINIYLTQSHAYKHYIPQISISIYRHRIFTHSICLLVNKYAINIFFICYRTTMLYFAIEQFMGICRGDNR